MNEKTKFRIVDGLLLAMIILPFAAAIVLKVLYKPVSEGITITGAMIYFSIPMPLMQLDITEAQVNSLAVIIAMLGLCLYMTHGIAVVPHSKRQLAAEWVVEKVSALVADNMGQRFMAFAPFVCAILGLSAVVLTTVGAVKAMIFLVALAVAGGVSARIFLHNTGKKSDRDESDGGEGEAKP